MSYMKAPPPAMANNNNPWASYMPHETPSSSQPARQAYYEEYDGYEAPAQRPMYQQRRPDLPPSYDDVFPETSPSALQPPAHHGYGNDEKSIYRSQSHSSMAATSSSPSTADDDEILQQALAFTQHAPPPGAAQARRLQRPVAVPQVTSGAGMSFHRAYAAILAEHGISMEEFVEFIDNLNTVSSSSPPLQILDLAGGIVGMVPFHYAQFVSLGLQTAVKLGNAAVMKVRGNLFMKKINTDFFNPRGLKVELATGAALKAKIGLDPKAPMTASLAEGGQLSSIQRTMAALHGFVEPLIFDVPPPNAPTNLLNKLCAKQQAMVFRKQEKKAQKEWTKYGEKSAEVDDKISKEAGKQAKELLKLDRQREKEEAKRDRALQKLFEKEKSERKREKEEEKIMKDFQKEMRDLEKEYEKVQQEYDKEVRNHEKDRRKENKEGKKAEKSLWILVESL